jgi:hypothetical protein
MGLCSPTYCSEISCLCWWYDWIHSCSYGNNSEVLLICFNKVMVLLMGPIRVCCLGCAVYQSNGVHCVLYIFCVLDIFVLNGGLFVKYMIFGMYYT